MSFAERHIGAPSKSEPRSILRIYAGPAGLAVLLAIMLALPFFAGAYGSRVGGTILMYIALAQSWNLIGGYVGLMSLAHSAFFGMGAMGATILLLNGAPVLLAAGGGIVLASIVALLIGAPTLRLQGHYFVIATLIVSEAIMNGARNLNILGFHGAISQNIGPYTGLDELTAIEYNRLFYFIMAGLAGLAMLLVALVQRSRWGLALKAIRDAEGAASAIGVPVANVKRVIFVVSAALAAAVGITSSVWLGTFDTTSAFDLAVTFQVIVMVFLGGRGTVWGPVIGVFLVFTLNEFIGVEFAEISTIISGAIVVAIVLLQPDGLIEVFRRGPVALSPRVILGNFRRYRVD